MFISEIMYDIITIGAEKSFFITFVFFHNLLLTYREYNKIVEFCAMNVF